MALVACRLHKRSAVRCVRDACTVYACLRLLTSRAMSLHLTLSGRFATQGVSPYEYIVPISSPPLDAASGLYFR